MLVLQHDIMKLHLKAIYCTSAVEYSHLYTYKYTKYICDYISNGLFPHLTETGQFCKYLHM